MMKKALVVVDFQNDFVDGALGFEKAHSLKERVLKLVSEFKGDLLFTFDTHEKDYLATKEGRNLPVPHCIKESAGWQMSAEFTPFLQKATKIFEKSTFGSLDLAEFLKAQQYEQIEFCGLVSHICVFHNIILAFNALPNVKLILHQNATASFDEELEKHAFELLKAFWVEIV